MVKARCIDKVRNKYNIITGYTLQDNTGYTITVEPKQLKNKINSGEVDVINLRLTQSGRLVDKKVENTLNELVATKSDTENDRNQYNKALMLGIAPMLNEAGYVIEVNSNRVIFNNATNKIAKNIVASNTKAEFNGNKELEKSMKYIGISLDFREIIINNPCIMSNISNKDVTGITVSAPKILINHKFITLETVNEIFETFKNQVIMCNGGKVFIITFNTDTLNKNEIFTKTEKLLNKQKYSGKLGRRAYELLVYLEFIYSMWISTGSSDKRYKTLAKDYIYEIKSLAPMLRSGMGINDGYAEMAICIRDNYLDKIIKDMDLYSTK